MGCLQSLLASHNGQLLLQHLLASHTRVEQVGAAAREAGVGTLVLTHLIAADVDEAIWLREARAGFDGTVIAGRDLLTV